MTTFNELLGTKPGDTESTVKQRYKLLSTRVHPDKGGSKALMQLVRHAYDNIVKGRGESALSIPASVSASGASSLALERELLRAKKERDEFEALNQLLKVQLTQARKGQGIGINTNANADFSRKVAQLEGELVLLKEERNRLALQKESAIAEQNKLAGELRRALSDNEVMETELDRKSGMKMPGLLIWAQKFWLPAMAMSSLVIVLVLSVKMLDWSFVTGWFDETPPEAAAPIVRVVHAKPSEEQVALAVSNVLDAVQTETETQALPFLKLTQQTGIWSLASYTESNKPYIAIRSDNGSYIVNDCSGDFSLYLNEPYKPLRVAANLIYQHQNQHFHVYRIPYGQGSSAKSWIQSRKLKINEEFFTSKSFKSSRLELLDQCQKTTL
ncbi:hypothetical protein LRP50_16365 [Enterovibrio sp. ZSDZ42]|uniref:J domain-containing protein n=1 Tax=Enterovibrio gelatinilyticus TaxID=2899819 RepID=A0ABT5R4F0_9GAMM|nr:hypothetical protein [Enterovibrio sp. ZSDZ42]MDD1794710.1 hypothetical protein [Enterovibrio sp. ZSDZ42]